MNFIELSKLFHKNGFVYIKKINTALMDEYQDKIYNNFKEDSRDS
ncbi:hypothetical protein OAM80_01290 [Gammaproteobacteria bacterium]|jgi:hypothetical protein|nr:hypothetical protein [Gammaproteobacteria bacterium]|tara:strand:- start:428 stop:562 length:135 start_codon:yes stop_codon:yes gene_type:complete